MDPTDSRPAADYDVQYLRAELAPAGFTDITVLDTVDSTNQWLARRVQETGTPDLAAVVTGFQSAGRGRLDREWFTPPGVALTFSVACTPRTAAGDPWPAEYLPWLTLLMAHSVTHVARRAAGVPAVIKWPNDVLVNSRKMCGVLASIVGRPDLDTVGVVVGAGLNVSQDELPIPTATSLRLETEHPGELPGRQALLIEILREFARCYHLAGADLHGHLGPGGEFRAELEAQVDTIGRHVNLHLPGAERPRPALAQGLGASGQLLVRDADGAVRSLSAGDVVHVRAAQNNENTPAMRRAEAQVRRIRAGEAR